MRNYTTSYREWLALSLKKFTYVHSEQRYVKKYQVINHMNRSDQDTGYNIANISQGVDEHNLGDSIMNFSSKSYAARNSFVYLKNNNAQLNQNITKILDQQKNV